MTDPTISPRLCALLNAFAAYPGCNNPATWSVIDSDGELYREMIAAGAEVVTRYYAESMSEWPPSPFVIDSALLVIDGLRLHAQLDSRTPTPAEIREHEPAHNPAADSEAPR